MEEPQKLLEELQRLRMIVATFATLQIALSIALVFLAAKLVTE